MSDDTKKEEVKEKVEEVTETKQMEEKVVKEDPTSAESKPVESKENTLDKPIGGLEEEEKKETEIGVDPPVKKDSDDLKDEEETLNSFIEQATGPENNLSEYVSEIVGTDGQIIDTFEALDKKYTKEQMEELMSDRKSYPNKLYRASVKSDDNRQNNLLSVLADKVIKGGKKLESSSGLLQDKISNGAKSSKASGNVVLTGPSAKTAVLAKLRGLKRIFLLNSGFYIDIRPHDLSELNSFYYSVDEEAKEMGNILGGHMYLFEDANIKRRFCEMLPSIVQASNLKNWRKGNNLIKNISFHDYDTIVWASCTLQYRKGIELSLVCANPDCQHIDNNTTVDLNKLRYNVFDHMSTAAVEFLTKGVEVTHKELKVYREELLFEDMDKTPNEYTWETKNGMTIKAKFQVPTLQEWLNESQILLSKLAGSINGDLNFQNEQAKQVIMLNIYQMFKPWISSITITADGDDTGVGVADRDAIMYALDITQQESGTLRDHIINYLAATKLTHICYTALKCPMCGAEPMRSVKDFTPVDVQQLFFYLACRRIVLAGTH